MTARVFISEDKRIVRSETYNMVFSALKNEGGQIIEDGTMFRWGETMQSDPLFSPYGPEIADIEISSGRCSGVGMGGCLYCYKNNSPNKPLQNMSFETYKVVLDKLRASPCLSQVALGLTGVRDNPDLIRIMRYTRDNGIFPNFTLTGADLDGEMAADLADLCGGLAVSCSPQNPDLCFDTVQLFTSLGVKQTNIHVVVSQETIEFVKWVLAAQKTDPRLQNMNAIVGLMIKPKGRAAINPFNPPSEADYSALIRYALGENIRIGFDSCSANRFVRTVNKSSYTEEVKKYLIQLCDPCESLCFSIYVNVEGRVFPCSFGEPSDGWSEGIDLLKAENFLMDVWFSPRAMSWREKLLGLGRDCPLFPSIR